MIPPCYLYNYASSALLSQLRRNHKHSVRVRTDSIEAKNNYSLEPELGNSSLLRYVRNVQTMSQSTSYQYHARLTNFKTFVSSKYETAVDDILKKINQGLVNPYELLSDYSAYLLNGSNNISSLTLKQRVITVKNFLEYYDVDLSPRKFKLKVKLPKVVRKHKEALSKQDIVDILNACSDIRLKTYVMFLAAVGCRAIEALSLRYADLDLNSSPAKVYFKGEYTKTKVDRYAFLTGELVRQLSSWLEYKHRSRRICYKDTRNGKTQTEYRTLAKDPNHLIFAVNSGSPNTNPDPQNIYFSISNDFAKTLDRMGRGAYEDNNRRRRKITLHSCRRFTFGTISDLGYSDYASWFIGHIGSTYYRKTSKEKEEIFRKIEPSLTFLDFPSIERKGADFQSKIDVLEQENLALRQRDSTNTDAIASLSDQLTKVMQDIETMKKQQK
jgi:integrase